MSVKMHGNLLDPGKSKQRAIFLLKSVRHSISWALAKNPDPDELAKYEGGMNISGTTTFEAHGEDEALLALIVTAYRFIQDPETIRRPEKGGRSSIEKSEAQEVVKASMRAAY